VLQYASPPEKKSKPRRSLIVIAVGIMSLLIAVPTAFALDHYKNLPAAEKDDWQTLFERYHVLVAKVIRYRRKSNV
jgi:hypothetical protein